MPLCMPSASKSEAASTWTTSNLDALLHIFTMANHGAFSYGSCSASKAPTHSQSGWHMPEGWKMMSN